MTGLYTAGRIVDTLCLEATTSGTVLAMQISPHRLALPIVLLALLTLGSGLFLTYPALMSFASEGSHAKLQGAAFGFVFFFQLLGGAIGSFAAGAVTVLFPNSPDLAASAPFWLAGVVSLATAAYLLALRTRGVGRAAVASPVHTPP